MLSKLNIIDNSGARHARVIRILKKKSVITLGGLVLVSVLKTITGSKIRKGQVVLGVIVTGDSDKYNVKIACKKTLILVKLPSKGRD
jgi:ribosomal protein L14